MTRKLRIFLCCQHSRRRHDVPAYSFWADYFRGGLSEAKHTWIEAPECDWAEGLISTDRTTTQAWQERTWSLAVEFLRREHARAPVDLFLAYLFPKQVLPAALSEIRALGIPCVNFFCDNVREFRSIPAEFNGFDLHWVPEYKGISLYRHANLPYLSAPMPCWVPPSLRAPIAAETSPITFVGTRDEQREALFAEAFALGLQADLRGTGWQQADTKSTKDIPRTRNPIERLRRQHHFAIQHGSRALIRKWMFALQARKPIDFDFSKSAKASPTGDDYWSVLRNSVVCIGVNRFPSLRRPFDQPGTYSRLRDIEAPMAGACYLTEWTEGLSELYDLTTEIETYRNAEELADRATELAADAKRRASLRKNGQRRALSDHSIPCTIAKIANRLGIPR